LQVPKRYYDRFPHIAHESRRRYAAMLNFMNDAIETVVDEVVAKGIWDQTLVVFSADNV
jgi:arylsulfatase A-like enzyme